jgi:hypothetical protein
MQDVFNLRSFDLSPGLGLPLSNYILNLYYRSLTLLVIRKLSLTHWFSLEIHVIGTERRAQVRPTWSLFETIGAMVRTSGQPQVKLSLLCSSNSSKIYHMLYCTLLSELFQPKLKLIFDFI